MLGTIWGLLRNFFSWQLVGGFAAALLVMFVISHLVWMYEHPVNEAMWPRTYLAGIGESFWWTLSIFLVGGADNKGPVGMGGRVIATIWMLASVIAVSLLTASLSAVLTVNSLPATSPARTTCPGSAWRRLAEAPPKRGCASWTRPASRRSRCRCFRTFPHAWPR